MEFLGTISAVLLTFRNTNHIDGNQGDVYISVSFHGYIWPLEVPLLQGMDELTLYLESVNAETNLSLSNDSSTQNAVRIAP